VRRLRHELWQQKKWLLRHDNALFHTFFFAMEYFTKKMTVVPHPPYFSVSPIEDKTERPRF
jgi:hypothetical protein